MTGRSNSAATSRMMWILSASSRLRCVSCCRFAIASFCSTSEHLDAARKDEHRQPPSKRASGGVISKPAAQEHAGQRAHEEIEREKDVHSAQAPVRDRG